MAAPPRVFGETLAHEHIRGGAFVNPDGAAAADAPRRTRCPTARAFFGGAQHHRWRSSARGERGALPRDFPRGHHQQLWRGRGARRRQLHAHGVRVARAKETFEPYGKLGFHRKTRALLPAAMYLLQKEGRI